MALGDEEKQPEMRYQRQSPYEHSALEPEQGYWAGRWAEFKRLWLLSWKDGYTKETLILCAVVWVVMLFGMTFLGWR